MKQLLTFTCLLIFFCGAVNAQKTKTKKTKSTITATLPDLIPKLERADTVPTKEDSILNNIPEKTPDPKAIVKSASSPCACTGSGFDTCCPVKKICCETKLIDTPATVKNKLKKKYGNYTLQKNFTDAEPFVFPDFSLLYGKSNICIRICNINRLAFDVSSKGVVQAVALKDTGIFDELAKKFKVTGLNIPDTVTNKTPPVAMNNNGPKDKKHPKTPKKTKKQTDLEALKVMVAFQKNLITALAQTLEKDIRRMNLFANFAKNAKTIVGSERGLQTRLKYNLGNEANIKAFDETINFDGLPNLINNDVLALFDKIKETLDEVNKLKGKIKDETDGYIKKYGQTDMSFADLPKDEEKIIKIATDADKAELIKTQEALIDLWIKVNDESNFFYVQCFGRGDGESISIDFKATPNGINKNRFDTVPYTYSVPVKGKFKWAIGPSLNFHFGKSLINETYSLDSSRGIVPGNTINLKDTFNISKNPQRAKLIPYVGFMAHFYWQSNKMITPAISIGLSTSPTQLSDLRAYLGASAIIGGPIKGKLIFSAGLAGAAVDRLKVNLVEGNNPKNRILFNGNNLPSPDQLVDKVFAIGGFFGMTYNLKD